MQTLTLQSLAVALGGITFSVVIVVMTRRGLLALRYALGWLSVSLLLVVSSVLLGAVAPLASALGMTPTGLLLGAVGAFLLLLCLQLSIFLSRVQESVRDVSEAHALLDARLDELWQAVSAGGVSGSPGALPGRSPVDRPPKL